MEVVAVNAPTGDLGDDVHPHGDPTLGGVVVELFEHWHDRLAQVVVGAEMEADVRNHRDTVWCWGKELEHDEVGGGLAGWWVGGLVGKKTHC